MKTWQRGARGGHEIQGGGLRPEASCPSALPRPVQLSSWLLQSHVLLCKPAVQ